MPINIADISPTPKLPTQYPQYSNGKLEENKVKFAQRVHARLFYNRVNSSQYTADFGGTPHLEFAGTNQTEQDAINKLSSDCKAEAELLAEEIFAWFQAATRGLQVKTPHEDSVSAHALLTTRFFPVEKGGGTEAKGIEL